MPRNLDPAFLARRIHRTLVHRNDRVLPATLQNAIILLRLHDLSRSDELYGALLRAYIHLLLARNEITGLRDVQHALDSLRAPPKHEADAGVARVCRPPANARDRRRARREAAINTFLGRTVGSLTIATHANYDERSFLSLNPDVQRGVSEGSITCGFEYFLGSGQHEKRLVRVADRRLPPILVRWLHRYTLYRLRRRIRTR